VALHVHSNGVYPAKFLSIYIQVCVNALLPQDLVSPLQPFQSWGTTKTLNNCNSLFSKFPNTRNWRNQKYLLKDFSVLFCHYNRKYGVYYNIFGLIKPSSGV
jgi:hypothetical protein